MDGTIRDNIYKGLEVDIVLKKNQVSGILTHGVVKDILTSKAVHPRGIKVILHGGEVGRVQKIYTNNSNYKSTHKPTVELGYQA